MGQDIHALIRLRKWAVDEQRRVLGELLSREAQLIQHQQELEASIQQEQKIAAADAMGIVGMAYGDFAKAAVAWREKLRADHKLLEQKILAQRDKVAEVFQDFKTLEQIQGNRDRRAALERGRKEQAVLDEMAANTHRRRREKS